MLKHLAFSDRLQRHTLVFSKSGMRDPVFAVDEIVPVASAVAQEIAIDSAVETIANAPQFAVTLAGDRIAT